MTQPRQATILLVDDDRLVLSSLASQVERGGYRVVTAASWSDAVRSFREDRPDLVLLDVMMPTLDGYKLASFMKRGGPFVPVILLTALDDLDSKQRGMEAGADDFLTKPVDEVELQIRILSMLRIKQLTDALQQANERLLELAITDPLTGLYNRRHLFDQLEREMKRAERYRRPLSILLFDLDHFKDINDRQGHPVGDKVLAAAAAEMSALVRSSDVAARFGGEEFIVVAPETGVQGAYNLAERIRVAIAELGGEGRELPAVTTSCGVCSTQNVGLVPSRELIRLADEALYRAKQEGRNRIVIVDEDPAAQALPPVSSSARRSTS